MLIGCRNNIIQLSDHKLGNYKLESSKYATCQRPSVIRFSHNTVSSTDGFNFQEAKERIMKTFGKIELSPSSYDTAWVAMVPSRNSINKPCFPECLDWIIENQREDGSWGLNPSHPLLVKDSLSSTLACLLALSKWGVGDNHVQRGLGFIERHGEAIHNEDQISPEGFHIIFPGMIKCAKKLNLNLPLDPDLVKLMINRRELTIERGLKKDYHGNIENLEYVAEGLDELCHWKELMLHQRNNGSLFDSPATTAAALIYNDQHDEKCIAYLNSILKLHNNWVPTIYPTKVHSYICLVDTVQNLGVERYFKTEVKSVVDELYRLWQQKNDEIFSDVTNCAMAFRLLRMNNYEVSSEELLGFIDQEYLFKTSRGQLKNHVAVLELHQASQVSIHDRKDHTLDKIYTWTKTFMEQKLLDEHVPDRLKKEMELALRKFYTTYERVETRRYIESYEMHSFKILKAAYRPLNINNVDFPKVSVHDFNLCQAQHREELQQLKRWFEDCRLDQVKLSEQYLYTSYFMIVVFLFEPEYSEVRLAYAKLVMLVTVVDDLFDGFACRDELHNIIELVKRWNEYSTVKFYSESVEIFFSALFQTIEDIAEKGHIKQGRSIKDHLINMWLDLLNCMLVELDWWENKTTPSMEEYLAVAGVTGGVECFVLTTQYLLGPKLSKEIIESSETSVICNCAANVARLLNDIGSYKREQAESSANMVSILTTQSQGTISEEEAIIQIKEMIESNRRQLLGMVIKRKESQLPQVCKDLFWKTCKLACATYSNSDEFRSPEKVKKHMNEVIYTPVDLSQ